MGINQIKCTFYIKGVIMDKKHYHNEVTRYSHGTYCRQCKQFFAKGTPEYMKLEGISNLEMAFHNLYCHEIKKENPDTQKSESLLKYRDALGKDGRWYYWQMVSDEQAVSIFEKYKKILMDEFQTGEDAACIVMGQNK
jgi:hypothetical protein